MLANPRTRRDAGRRSDDEILGTPSTRPTQPRPHVRAESVESLVVLCARWVMIVALGAVIGAPAATADTTPLGTYRFRSFGSADGLHNLVVVSLTQDSAGSLWAGTDDGVYRYQGDRFSNFAGAQGVPSTEVYVVGTDPEGRACAGTLKGLACWDGAQFSRRGALGLPEVPVYTIRAYRDQLWVGTSEGLFRRERGTFARAPGWSFSGPVRALWADDRGIVVGIGARVLLGTGDGTWQPLAVGLADDRVDGVLRDRTGALWIRCAQHLWRVAPGAASAEDVSAGLPTGYDSVGVAESMVDVGAGDVWVGSDVGIAHRVDGKWVVLDHGAGLPTSRARTLFLDRENTMWVGSIGLFQLRGRGLIERHGPANGLPGEVVWSFARDRDGQLWVGTSHCLAHVVDGSWRCFPGSEKRVVRSFVFPPQGGVFLGGAPSDLLYIDPQGHATSLAIAHAPVADHLILALRIGVEGDLWIATKTGLYRLPGAVPGAVEPVAIPGVTPGARFSSLLVDDGRLWSATPDGVVVLDRGAWRRFDVHDGFRASAMRYIVRSHDGRLCAAYTEALGVSCFQTDGTRVSAFEHFGVAEGLTSGVVYFLGEDRRRRLWIGTGDGLDVITPTGIEHFSESDGLAGNDSAGTAFFEDSDGSLWLGSTGGATHFHAERYSGPLAPPRVVVREGMLGSHAIVDERGVLDTPYDANGLAVAFGATTLVDSQRLEYQIRLRPLDTQFSTTKLPRVRYAALAPGSYALEVRARIDTAAWGPLTTLQFTVAPAWWQTRSFYGLIAVGGLGLLAAGLHLWQRAALRRQSRRLEDQATAELRSLLEAFPDLVSVYRDGKLTYLNAAARRMWCTTESEIPDLHARTHPDDQPRRVALLARVAAAANDFAETIELRLRDRHGEYRVFEATYSRQQLSGAPVIVVTGRDVTERNRLRAQLLLSDRMASLGTLAAGIAHEINNPLAYVIGSLETMSEALGSAGPAAADFGPAIHGAIDGAERVRKIVAGLRSFSRSEEEKRAPLAIGDVLQSAIRLTTNEVRHRAQLVCELGPTPLVIADSGRLTQVFINLIVNAAQAIPEGRTDANRITLRTSTDELGRAVVAVSDTGCGMPPDVLARAFDPFFTTKDVGAGTGLGLAICHGIISAIGGEIRLESTPGQGTTAWIVLPAAVEAPLPVVGVTVTAPARPVASATRLRVMVVDDDSMVAEMMASRLRRDHEVVVMSCGKDALATITAGNWFDAIISDVMMPNMTGIELLDRVIEIAPRQAERLMFLSGGVFAPESRARLDALGALLLEKPVDIRDLRAALAQIAGAGSAAPRVA